MDTKHLAKSVAAVVPKLSAEHRQILAALLGAPRHAATNGELRQALHFDRTILVNNAMVEIGHKMYDEMRNPTLQSQLDGRPPWYLVAEGLRTGGGFMWQLRPEAVKGLIRSGLRPDGTMAQ